jgi:hypothetical protein
VFQPLKTQDRPDIHRKALRRRSLSKPLALQSLLSYWVFRTGMAAMKAACHSRDAGAGAANLGGNERQRICHRPGPAAPALFVRRKSQTAALANSIYR